MRTNQWKTKHICIALTLFVLFGSAAFVASRFYKSKQKDNVIKQEYQSMNTDTSQYVRLTNDVSQEMLASPFWGRLAKQNGHDINKMLMSERDIHLFNVKNRDMIHLSHVAIALQDIEDVLQGDTVVSLIKAIYAIPKNPKDLLREGKPTNKEYWDNMVKQTNQKGVPQYVKPQFGFAVARTNLRNFPSADKVFYKGDSLYYDYLVNSDLLPTMPVVVLHESLDQQWVYVLTYGYGGWTKKENIAFCKTRADWLKRQQNTDFIIVTEPNLRISTDPYHKQVSDLLLPMGTKLEILKLDQIPRHLHHRATYGNYVAKLPIRKNNGEIDDQLVLIPANDNVSLGYLPYTEENVLKQAFKFIGMEYGWGGSNNAQDCSSMVRAIYACFGFALPRGGDVQVDVDGVQRVNTNQYSRVIPRDWNLKRKRGILENAPIGTLLYFPGHVMLYLGMYNGSPYCISSIGSFATKDMKVGEAMAVNGVVVTSMEATTRRNGRTWLESIERITSLVDE